MEEFIEKCSMDLESTVLKWKQLVNISEGKMRATRGADIEKFVLDTINKIGLKCNINLYAKNGNKDHKILEIDNITKKHQVDIHIYKNDIFYSVIECKSYLDNCYYTRACSDFKIFDKFHYVHINSYYSFSCWINFSYCTCVCNRICSGLSH